MYLKESFVLSSLAFYQTKWSKIDHDVEKLKSFNESEPDFGKPF